MKNSKSVLTLLLLSYWAYLSVVVLHEAYLLTDYLDKITISIQKDKANQSKRSLEQSAKLLCVQNQNFEKQRFEQRNSLLTYWQEQENRKKYGTTSGLSYEYLYVEWLEEGFTTSEINNKIIARISQIPQKLAKKARETLFLGLFLLFVYLAGEFFNLYKIVPSRRKLRFFKSLGLFLGAILGAYLAMLLISFLFNFVIIIALVAIPLFAFFGEKIGLMAFNLMKKK